MPPNRCSFPDDFSTSLDEQTSGPENRRDGDDRSEGLFEFAIHAVGGSLRGGRANVISGDAGGGIPATQSGVGVQARGATPFPDGGPGGSAQGDAGDQEADTDSSHGEFLRVRLRDLGLRQVVWFPRFLRASTFMLRTGEWPGTGFESGLSHPSVHRAAIVRVATRIRTKWMVLPTGSAAGLVDTRQ